MNRIVSAKLVSETVTQDSVGQNIKTQTFNEIIGKVYSVFQREFYQAEQYGLRPEGVIETCAFDYNGERILLLDEKEYSIYRTFLKGTDRIELYFGERVGNGK